MRLADFDYAYPHALIAHHPLPARDAARLMLVSRDTGAITHTAVRDLPAHLRPGDLLVINTSKVIPARLLGRRPSGGKVEILLLQPEEADRWWCLATPMHRLKPGERLTFAAGLTAIVGERREDRIALSFQLPSVASSLAALIDRVGLLPLPPYIDRRDGPTADDRARYQTVYADVPGSAAAPTAGLHFSPALLERCRARGVRIARLQLHVGSDTFAPVRTDLVEAHVMHGERYVVPDETLAAVDAARCEGRRVIAVGTTAVRALESAAHSASRGATNLFIYPGYRFRIVDALLTNFHQPRSTLLMLVSAFAGLTAMRRAYATAIAERYRLFSYGDAMLIA